MTFYNGNGKPKKTAKLNPKNWEKQGRQQDICFYRHKTRKKVVLHYNVKLKTGYFWDTQKDKPISENKNIRWL